jgi:hypothetical protein
MENLEKEPTVAEEMNILNKTFEEMPNQFTGREWSKKLLKNGFLEKKIKDNKNRYFFLQMKAENLGYKSKTWIKKPEFQKSTGMFKDEEPIITSRPIETIKAPEINEEKAIEFLKSKGYKIMKPVSNWEEI